MHDVIGVNAFLRNLMRFLRMEKDNSVPTPLLSFSSIHFSTTGVKKIVHYTEDFFIKRFVSWRFHCITTGKGNIRQSLGWEIGFKKHSACERERLYD